MYTSLTRKPWSNTIQTRISGRGIDAQAVKERARAFAKAAGAESELEDFGPHVRLFIAGEWETADGEPVRISASEREVRKIGRKYFYVPLSGPDGTEITKVTPSYRWDDSNPRVFIREGTAAEYTKI